MEPINFFPFPFRAISSIFLTSAQHCLRENSFVGLSVFFGLFEDLLLEAPIFWYATAAAARAATASFGDTILPRLYRTGDNARRA